MTLASYWSNDRASDRIDHQQRITANYYGQREIDRGDSSGSGWAISSGSSKSKKAEKKQAAMSALTLIAFLFFLNILQNCLKEQNQKATETVMVVNSKLLQGREPQDAMFLQDKIDQIGEEKVEIGRKLLSVHDEEDGTELPQRDSKFIHDVGSANHDWTNELTQVSDGDIIDQQQKVSKLREILNHRNRDRPNNKQTFEDQVVDIKVKKFVNNPVLSDLRSIPKLSQYWEAQRTSTTPEAIKYVEFEEPVQKVADFYEFRPLRTTTPGFSEVENSLIQNVAANLQSMESKPIKEHPIFKPDFLTQEAQEKPEPIPTAASYVMEPIRAVGVAEPVHDSGGLDNTPRYRRGSEEQPTTSESIPEDLFRPEANQVTPTPTVSSTKTYHVYTHPSQMHSGIWHTTPYYKRPHSTTPSTTQEPTTQQTVDINSIYLTTARPPPGRIFGAQRHPPNHRPYYSPPSNRYDYSPNRRVAYEPTYLRQEYYPMSVVGQYGGDEEGPTAGILQLLWSLITSFARPIVSLVPNASKVGRESPCVELMACEAHRLGKYMGPTAQVLATTFSSIMRWISPDAQRMAIDDAMDSARQDTCMRQIDTCDVRSGGQSLLTGLAKMLELKSNREPKLRR